MGTNVYMRRIIVQIPNLYYFCSKGCAMEKASNKIVIENPPKKVLDFVLRMQKEKEEARKHLLEKKEHTFSIQL